MILITLSLVSTFIVTVAVLNIMRWRSRLPLTPLENPPTISIIKPVRGLEADLLANLTSFFMLDGKVPFELLFCVKDPKDPSIAVIKALVKQYPQVKTRLFVGSPNLGRNPKISNIHSAWNSASSDLILISDSNVRVPADYLQTLLQYRSEGVGMVTQMLYGADAHSPGSHLDAVHLNTFYLKATAFLNLLGFPAVSGKAMLLSRSQFEKLGGLFAVRNYLAEDLVTSDIMRSAGLKVVMAPQLLRQTPSIPTLRDYWNRHVRWARLRKSHFFFAYLLEPLFFETLWPVLAMITASSLKHFLIGFSCFAIQGMGNLVLYHLKFRDAGTRDSFVWFLFKDLMAPLIWFGGLVSNKVLWRGNVLYLRFGGKLGSKSIWEARWRLAQWKLNPAAIFPRLTVRGEPLTSR